MYASGRFQINGQFVKLGPRHAGKIVTVVIEDTHFRILRGEDELAVRPRKNPGLITRLYVKGMGQLAFTESMVDGTAERISALGASRTAPQTYRLRAHLGRLQHRRRGRVGSSPCTRPCLPASSRTIAVPS
ncbi:hypothetical protein ACFVWP_34405 [Streptomyces sp. NPDC058175]|uniref:hypothetical protein n=1 Tax=Streptomyces sp. NPDC058175 TaxID=3346367 RepID=UPI0036EF12FD